MKTCPYCDAKIPIEKRRCPSCGALYWESDDAARDSDDKEEEESQGCLSIFAQHFLVALAAFVLLLLIGFVFNLLVHFEENQIKVVWIGTALLVAVAISAFIGKLKKNK
jgi:uncharacterized membrane protein YvbJ